MLSYSMPPGVTRAAAALLHTRYVHAHFQVLSMQQHHYYHVGAAVVVALSLPLVMSGLCSDVAVILPAASVLYD